MKTSHALLLGLTFGLFAATAVSCGGSRACSPTTCPTGCCSTSGLCESGSSGTACGSRGAACTSCGVTATCIAGACMQGGLGSTGGGSSATGGGSAAGGSAAGGSAAGGSAAGGSAAGGSAAGGSAAGGSAAGGSAGGSAGGGSAGGATAFCARLEAAMTRFFAGRSSCGAMGVTLTNSFNASACREGYPSCSSFDIQALTAGTMCIETTTVCSTGNDSAAIQSISPCLATISDISPTCAGAMGFGP
ncbi:MAG: hypothetical protein JNJ54_24670 [Myxococcaceae bacterium]|nr:hypothetical protein [Myxococcaceae bacterium]